MFAQMQPRHQNQVLQGLKLGGRQLLHAPGSGVRDMSGSAADDTFWSPMSATLASKCNHVIMRYIQEQRNRPHVRQLPVVRPSLLVTASWRRLVCPGNGRICIILLVVIDAGQ
jgi:hypothetical protein